MHLKHLIQHTGYRHLAHQTFRNQAQQPYSELLLPVLSIGMRVPVYFLTLLENELLNVLI